MKTFIKYALLFMLPIIILAIAAECFMRSIPNEYKYKNQWMNQHADSLETLVIGSSVGFYGVRPEFFSTNAFNLATISERPEYDYFLLKKYLPISKKLKNVVYPLFYEIFVDPPFEQSQEWPRASYFKIYMDCPYHSWLSKYSLETTSFTAMADKYNKYKLFQGKDCDSLGYGLHYQLKNKKMNPEDSEADALKAVIARTNVDSKYKEYNYEYVCRVAQLCKENNIRLIMVAFPSTHTFNRLRNKIQLNDFYKRVNQIVAKYNCELHDFSDDNSFTCDDFFDATHLTELGAKKLTIKIDSIISTQI